MLLPSTDRCPSRRATSSPDSVTERATRRVLRAGTTALALACTTGCASTTFRPSAHALGEYKDLEAITEAAERLEEGSAGDVKVLVETLPDGMSSRGGELAFDRARYDLLGKIKVDYNNPASANFGFWWYRYRSDESWRVGLCSWQVPLGWATLSLWALLSPTYYPCRVSLGSEAARREAIVEAVQRGTKALGGNLAVLQGFGGILMVDARTRGVVGGTDALSGLAYAFRVKDPPTPAGAPAAEREEVATPAPAPPAPPKPKRRGK